MNVGSLFTVNSHSKPFFIPQKILILLFLTS
ncbi:hypothetical protein T01_8942 [Trichinella spiralis]|uniref:Uncharacterized protein n=1 Tax=Trichinella spiralis TaxID=6334 RepID=A0A0V0YUM7_TRISP|nr:hypothetical protein T01_8942 [Trichinella spiralis]